MIVFVVPASSLLRFILLNFMKTTNFIRTHEKHINLNVNKLIILLLVSSYNERLLCKHAWPTLNMHRDTPDAVICSSIRLFVALKKKYNAWTKKVQCYKIKTIHVHVSSQCGKLRFAINSHDKNGSNFETRRVSNRCVVYSIYSVFNLNLSRL